jgi:hypothetical protein
MSIYGERHKIFHDHHVETKAKLDSILAKNSEIEVNHDALEAKLDTGNASHASIDGKITACNTGAVVVASSALPSGASDSAKQDVGNASIASVDGKIVACNTGACVVTSCALPSGASDSAKQDVGNASIASVDGKVVACNTGAVVVASSALPSGAADSAKQDEIKALITATNTALAGTLSVSGSLGGGISKAESSPVNNQVINGQAVHVSSEIDVSASKHLSLIGSSTEIYFSHEVDLLVSNVSGGTFFKTSHSGYYLDGEFHMLVSNHPYKYVKVQVKNTDGAPSNSANFTIHLLTSN